LVRYKITEKDDNGVHRKESIAFSEGDGDIMEHSEIKELSNEVEDSIDQRSKSEKPMNDNSETSDHDSDYEENEQSNQYHMNVIDPTEPRGNVLFLLNNNLNRLIFHDNRLKERLLSYTKIEF